MKILAVEFSSAQRSVAVWECTVLQSSRCSQDLGSPGGTPGELTSEYACFTAMLLGRAQEIAGHRQLGLVEKALAEAGCKREEISVLAVGLGPGSYTGIRGSIALAQGWQLGREIKLLGISSVECLAAQAQAEGQRGPVNIIVDAQRNEFYLARYELEPGARRETEALRLAAFSEIEALAESGARLIGPDIQRWFPGAENKYPEASMLGRLACASDAFIPGEKLEPIYLREPAFKKAPPPREIP